ncbi:MAG: hypothetical protein ABIJ86_12500 [Spirochaetota bacterium]
MRTKSIIVLIVVAISMGAITARAILLIDRSRITVDLHSLAEADRIWVSDYINEAADNLSLSLRITTDGKEAKRADLAFSWADGNLRSPKAKGFLPIVADLYGLFIPETVEHIAFLTDWDSFINPAATIRERTMNAVAIAGDDDETLLAFATAATEATQGPQKAAILLDELADEKILGDDGTILAGSTWTAAVDLLRLLRATGAIASDWTNWDELAVFNALRDGQTACAFTRFSNRAAYAVLERGGLQFRQVPLKSGRTDYSVTSRVLAVQVTENGQKKEAAGKLAKALASGGLEPSPFTWGKPYLDFGETSPGRIERGYKTRLKLAIALLALDPVAPDSYAHIVAEAIRIEARQEYSD